MSARARHAPWFRTTGDYAHRCYEWAEELRERAASDERVLSSSIRSRVRSISGS